MTPTRRNRPIRLGFTLTEVLVGMALTLGMMVILTEAFKMALDFTGLSNSTTVMMRHLNSVEGTLRQDMSDYNFQEQDNKPNLGRRLSDQWMHNPGGKQWVPPTGGYVRIESPQTVVDATDAEDFNITSATNHRLMFTAIRSGGSESNLFAAKIGANVYTSQTAEVAYFLYPMPGNPTTPAGAIRYNLHRRFWLVAATNDDVQNLQAAFASAPTADVISTFGGTVNTLADLAANPNRRMTNQPGMLVPLPPPSGRLGDDVLASNILSFQVLPQWDNTAGLAASLPPRPFGTGPLANSDGPFDYLPGTTSTFDTMNNPPLRIRIRELQISVRIYDPNRNQARQSTWTFTK